MRQEHDQQSLGAYGLGGIGAVVVAGALVGVRGRMVNANVALVLVIVVVLAAALGGRGPGMATAVIAALAFDFFHTEPYLALTINSRDDVETAGLLLVVGLIVGEIASRARRSRAAATGGRTEIVRIHRLAEQVAGGADPADVIMSGQTELAALLDLSDCRFEAAPGGPSLPRLERSGALPQGMLGWYSHGGFELPAEGVELAVLSRGQPVGRFVLVPTPGRSASLEQRIVAVAIADLVGAALGQTRIAANGNSTKGAPHA